MSLPGVGECGDVNVEYSGDFTYLGNETYDMSNEKRAPGWLGYIRDEILPNFIGIIVSHYKDP